MISTETAIIITQIPIAIVILIGAYEIRLLRKELTEILRLLSKKK